MGTVDDVTELLKERRELAEKEREIREDAENLIAETLEEEDYVAEHVKIVSSYYEFNVVMSSRIGSQALRELDEVFDGFHVSGIHIDTEGDRPRLNIYFKRDNSTGAEEADTSE